MELDYSSVKALSSPTRIRILSEVIDKERNPTDLSEELGKSKSTVSSHLSTLEEAGLVEKNEKEGRRRVMYSASRKAEAIVKGKERKVKFSVVSSAISGLAGIALLSGLPWNAGSQYTSDGMGTMAMEAEDAARESSSLLMQDPIVFGIGVLALAVAVFAMVYALTLHRLPEK
ncbi:MAG: winged helix-turn-helix domain-containing protein [Candidatus Nanohaloarchaeota archaeon QJJ-7]|nr:winged helix-turn-helix domain-containing protein [Candidatus Nanohaloarchaeota archaeon QJJ-7]